MIDKIKNGIKKLYASGNKKLFMLIAAAIAVICIIPFVSGSSESDTGGQTCVLSGADITSLTETAIEEKIKTMVESIDGAGKVSVSVSLESTGTVHYAQDVNEKRENDSISKDSEYIYTEGTKGSPDGLVIRVDGPKIRGVAVVCDGGESSVIKSEIKSMIASLYAIGSDRIYVGK